MPLKKSWKQLAQWLKSSNSDYLQSYCCRSNLSERLRLAGLPVSLFHVMEYRAFEQALAFKTQGNSLSQAVVV
jgi:hypothetical protein